jgi:hypothetical protein
MRPFVVITAIELTALFATGATADRFERPSSHAGSSFISLTRFSGFAHAAGRAPGETVITSPEIDPQIAWDELVVSWNVRDADVGLKVEACGIYADHRTRFYTLGRWAADNQHRPRESVNGQRDADGDVRTDTLVLVRPGAHLQLRLTFSGAGTRSSRLLKFLGLSFCDSRRQTSELPPNRGVWGKSLPVPERSQLEYATGRDWCSPTSVSMALGYWAKRLNRPDLERDVPEIAAGVFDPQWPGTGNWPFNTAYAGRFDGLRAYITRLSDVSELEDWVAAGVPVVVSVSPGVLNGKPDLPDTGHLVVCVGFTTEGDVIMNDPWAHRDQGQPVRRTYRRQNLAAAWNRSHRTVYLIYPTSAKIPKDRFGHWEHR